MRLKLCSMLLAAAALSAAPVLAGDWYQWRGPEQNGVSRETGLPDSWDPDSGENVVWKKAGVGGMSSPIVMNGRVYTLTRTGDVPEGGNVRAGERTQEAIVCLDANTGEILWQQAENMFQTDLPFHRLGWSNVVGDPQTKRVYAYHAAGMLVARDAETGKDVWRRSMSEEFGMISTFGGRTSSPAIDDEDQLYIGGVAFGWGDHAKSQYRVFCFDKNSGELRWSQGSGGIPVDAPYNTPVIGVIGGQKLVVIGAGDGSVSAFQARTGKKVWSHQVSKRGLNASVLVDGDVVYACSSEENVSDTSKMGTVVAIDASGDKPKELWRADGQEVGFASPTIADGRLYVMTNSGRAVALDAKTGKQLWKRSAGTIGKASLVFADGKLYAPEANGRLFILQPGDDKAEVLSKVELGEEKLGREYGFFGSVAVANGRIYAASSNTLFCIGKKDAKPEDAKGAPVPEAKKEEPAAKDAKVAHVQVLPFDVVTNPGHSVKLRARTFDDKGRLIGEVKDAQWTVGTLEFEAPPRALPTGDRKQGEAPASEGGKPAAAAPQPAAPPAPTKIQIGNLKGEVSPDGTFTAGEGLLGGGVYAKVGDATGVSRVRVIPPLPWNMGFTRAGTNRPPITWIGAGGKFEVQDKAGEKLITKLTNIDLYARARTYFGSAGMANYAVQADVMADEKQLGQSEAAAAGGGNGAADGAADGAAKGASDAVVKVASAVAGADTGTDAAQPAAEKSAEDKALGAEESTTLQPKPTGRRFVPDVGVINSRYSLVLLGSHQRLTLHAWPPELPHALNRTIPFKWEPHKWYTMKLQVTQKGKTALVQGKVWAKGEQEPEKWTVELEDTLPNTSGAPGIFGNSGVTPGKALVYWDNILVTGGSN